MLKTRKTWGTRKTPKTQKTQKTQEAWETQTTWKTPKALPAWLRSPLLLLAVVMLALFAVRPASAEAATTKVKKQEFTVFRSVVEKKATRIKVGKTYKLQADSEGFLTFTAPATKSYKFTFSGLKSVGVSSKADLMSICATAYRSDSSKYITSNDIDMKTQGGSSKVLTICTKYAYSLGSHASVTTLTALKTRYGQITLEKGQTLYFYLNGGEKFTCKLKVTGTAVKTSSGSSSSSGSISSGGSSSGSSSGSGSGSSGSGSYVGNRNSKVFHKAGCSSVKKMKDSNKVYMDSRLAYISAGYKPCGICKP